MLRMPTFFAFSLLLYACVDPNNLFQQQILPKKFIIASVSSFHALENNVPPKSFTILMDDKQNNNLEYKYYAKLIAQHLKVYGYKQVEDKRQADFAVSFYYDIDKGKEYQTTVPIEGVIDSGSSQYQSYYNGQDWVTGNSYRAPTYGTVGLQAVTNVLYTRKLFLTIADLKKKTNSQALKVYEGRVISKGYSGTFSEVGQRMIKALFLEFPGRNGVAREIEIELDD